MAITEQERAAVLAAQRDRLSCLKALDTDTGLYQTMQLMGLEPFDAGPQAWASAERMRAILATGLQEATALAIPSELCALVQESAPGYPDARVRSRDLKLTHGWAYFADPVADPQDPDGPPVAALLWWVYPLQDLPVFDPGEVAADRYALTILTFSRTRDLPGATPDNTVHLPRLTPTTSVLWELDTEDGGYFWDDSPQAAGREHQRVAYLKLLQTLWATIRQRLTQVDEASGVTSAPLSWYGRMRSQPVNQRSQVVRMRPSAPAKPVQRPGSGRKLTKRIPVNRYWRHRDTEEGRVAVLVTKHERGPWGAPEAEQAEKTVLPPARTDTD